MYENLVGKYVKFLCEYGTSVMRYEGTVISCDKDLLVYKNQKGRVYYFNMRYVMYIEEA